MEAKARDLNFLASEQIVEIPFFQRPYVWGKANWDDLLADLADDTRTHFLGSIILKQIANSAGEPSRRLVIDGKQRHTTLGVLIKALYDGFSADLRANALDAVRAILFFRKSPLEKRWQVKLQHSRVDRDAYEAVVRAGVDGPALSEADGGSRIRECYQHFVRGCASWDDRRRQRLFERLLDTQNKLLVVIDLGANDNEQAIFDTINSAGVRLGVADIVKNALFQRAIDLMGAADAVACHDRTWAASFLVDDEAIVFWSIERATGRLKRDNIEILLHAIAVIDGFYDPEQHSMSQLADLYKHKIAALATGDEVAAFANGICEYAQLYRDHLVAGDDTTYTFDDDVRRVLHLLDALDVSTFHPFVLYALRRGEREAVSLLRRLERFVVRRIVAGHETKSFNKLTKELVRDPTALDGRPEETSDDDVRSGLRSISNKLAAVLLFWVELKRRHDDPRFDEKTLAFAYTLEHVMPQKWEAHWSVIPTRTKPDGAEMSADEARRERSERVYWLGNMTLLTRQLNSSLRHAPFERKLRGEGRKKGLAEYASLSITRRDIVEPFERGDLTWDESKIEARTEALASEVFSIWPSA